jgi:hypothetical protein
VFICQPGQTFLSIGVILYFPCNALLRLSDDTLQQFKGVSISPMGQLDLINHSLRAIFKKILLLFDLAKMVTLALTSDLFNSPSSLRQKPDFLHFPGEDTPTPTDRTVKLAKSSETTVQRNSLRGCDPQVVSIPKFLEEQVAFSCLR